MAILAALVGIGATAAYAADRRRIELVRRDELITRIQHGEWAQVLLQERELFAARARRAQRVMLRHEHDQAAAERRRDELSRHAWRGEKWSLGFVVVACSASAVWAVLFTLQRAMDINALVSLDYPSPPALGTVIALAFAMIGTIVSGLLGMHALLPPWLRSPGRAGRITAALALATVSLTFIAYLQELAVAHPIDGMLGLVVPPLEMAFSAAPVVTTELAVVGFFALASNRAERRKLAAQRAIQAAKQDFAGYAVALIAEAGVATGPVRAVLAALSDLGVEPPSSQQGEAARPAARPRG